MEHNEVIRVVSIKDQVYQILKQEIIDCKLKSGEKLVEQSIAERFNVSRAPVREAIKQLIGDGLVVNITNRGAYVKIPTAKELEDMQEVRTLFEEHAVHHAVTILTEEHRQALQQIREEMLSRLTTAAIKIWSASSPSSSSASAKMTSSRRPTPRPTP